MYNLPEGRRRKSHLPAHVVTQPATPVTPQTRSATHTPPSLSARPPFDWDAARANRPLYATPTRAGPSSSRLNGMSTGQIKSKSARIYRHESFSQQVRNVIDVSLWLDLLLDLPSRVPLPESRMLGFGTGGVLNILHWLAWWMTSVEDDDSWELEVRRSSNWAWTIFSLLLLCTSFVNALFVTTRTKTYHLHLARDPVPSAHASFVAADFTLNDDAESSLGLRIGRGAWKSLVAAGRFLIGSRATPTPEEVSSIKTVQQLEIWNPGEGEVALLIAYSPVHSLVYQSSSTSLTTIFTVIPSVTILLFVLVSMYTALLKDRLILASEVMHEYNDKFVYPTIAPVKKDAETMTHEAEIIDFEWR